MSQFENKADNVTEETIPEALVQRDQWICWRYEEIGGKEKKPPYDPKTGQKCDCTDPQTWTDFSTAYDRYQMQGYDGLGFVLTEDDPIVGVDFDGIRNSWTGNIDGAIESILNRLDSYSEVSPSYEGAHTISAGEKPEGYANTDTIEVYDSGRFFTVTGNHIEGQPIEVKERQDELDAICKEHLPETQRTSDADTAGVNCIRVADPDSELVERGELALRTLQHISTPAFNDTMAFLQGGIPGLYDEDDDRFESQKMFKEDGRIDRDSHDTIALSLLYGTLRDYCEYDHEEAINTSTATYTHYCREHSWTVDGQRRRWLYESDRWREQIVTYALNSFDSKRFKQLVEKKGAGTRRQNNRYSELTYDAIWGALYDLLPNNPPKLSNDMDPENPETESRIPVGPMRAADLDSLSASEDDTPLHELYTRKDEVLDRAYEIDDGYNEWCSYEEAFRRLQSVYGEVKAARIGSSTWVYYPADYPDPPEASYVKQFGEKYDPNNADQIHSWTGEPETADTDEESEQQVMTDVA